MLDLAAFIGMLIGNGINPLVWGPVLLIVLSTKDWRAFDRIAVCVVGVGVIGTIFYSLDSYVPFPRKVIGLFFSVIAAVLWAVLFIWVIRWWRGSRA